MKKTTTTNTPTDLKRKADRYLKIVQWSDEDGVYVGRCPGLFFGGVHGDDEVKVYRELCGAVEEWIATIERDGKPLPAPTAGKTYSGNLMLRISPGLHEQIATQALLSQVSLNELIKSRLEASPAAV